MVVAVWNGEPVLKTIELNDGRKISFLHHACKREDSPTIVFVHGFPLDHTMWLGQLPLARHANLLMLDLPGFGASDPVTGDMTMSGLADDVASFLKKLGVSRVIFCGLSMGGYIGWEFAMNHPEMLEGLICCNTRANADDELTARARRIAAKQVLEDGTAPVAAAMQKKLFSPQTVLANVELINSVTEKICRTEATSVAAAQKAMAGRSDHSMSLARLMSKYWLSQDIDDSITPAEEMKEMSSLFAESAFVEIAEAGHLSPAENPDAFNEAVIRFL